jgi:hypothetical protein
MIRKKRRTEKQQEHTVSAVPDKKSGNETDASIDNVSTSPENSQEVSRKAFCLPLSSQAYHIKNFPLFQV